ncbi:MAG: GNAT family N-acetyltransferase [bacterium]|nr:GNAT family N-acetyltransferase [bacterium]
MAQPRPEQVALKDGVTVYLRPPSTEDAQAVLDFARTVQRDGEGMVLEPDESELTVEEEVRWIQEHSEHPDKLVLLALVDERIVGLVNFKPGTRRRLAHRGAFGVSVLPEWRDRGVGTALVRGLLEWAQANPRIHKVSLAVLANNARAIAVYRRLGFVEEGRRRDEVMLGEGEYLDDLLMCRIVR